MAGFSLLVGNHGVKIKATTIDEKFLLNQFCDELTSYEERWSPEQRRLIRTAKTLYAFKHHDMGTCSIHRNHLPHFLRFIDRLPRKMHIEMDYVAPYTPAPAEVHLLPDRPPFDEQLPVIEHMSSKETIVTVPLQTGKGKTYTSLAAMCASGVRCLVMCLPREIPTWKREARESLIGGDSNIFVVDGGNKLEKLIKMVRNNDPIPPIIMMSSPTMAVYLKQYGLAGKTKIGIPPERLMEFLGIGKMFTDETHERLAFNFQWSAVVNVPQAIYLTATLHSNNRFTNALYEVLCPKSSRITLVWDRYIDAYAIGYHLEDPDEVEYTGPRGSYSHDIFEQWILANARRTNNYLNLINDVLVDGYIDRYKRGMKAVVFFSKVDLCRLAVIHFSQLYPQFAIGSFNSGEGDPESILHESDIIFSTIQSAGTGKDVKGWMTTICTVAIDAKEKNIQILGRTRKPKPDTPWADDNCRFYYFVCMDVKTQMVYHENKVRTFTGRVRTLTKMRFQRKV